MANVTLIPHPAAAEQCKPGGVLVFANINGQRFEEATLFPLELETDGLKGLLIFSDKVLVINNGYFKEERGWATGVFADDVTVYLALRDILEGLD